MRGTCMRRNSKLSARVQGLAGRPEEPVVAHGPQQEKDCKPPPRSRAGGFFTGQCAALTRFRPSRGARCIASRINGGRGRPFVKLGYAPPMIPAEYFFQNVADVILRAPLL